jgi:hypothetical protein
MRFSTVAAFMLPLSALAAPSLVKRDYQYGDQYDGHQYDGHQYDGDVDKYSGWLRESKDYMYKAYEYAWKIDNLHDTITTYGYKDAWDKLNLDYEWKQLQEYHAPKQEVYVDTPH